jgi:hypothetical protein
MHFHGMHSAQVTRGSSILSAEEVDCHPTLTGRPCRDLLNSQAKF